MEDEYCMKQQKNLTSKQKKSNLVELFILKQQKL